MTVERYAFHDCEATTAAGVPLRIPAGVHHVERRSLVFRVRLGPFDRKDDADRSKARLDAGGIESALVRVQR